MCYLRQEYISVGCVPAARRPYAGVCFWEGGLPGPGGVVCLVWGGVVCLVPGGGVVCLVPGGSGMPGPGGWSVWLGGLSALGGWYPSMH